MTGSDKARSELKYAATTVAIIVCATCVCACAVAVVQLFGQIGEMIRVVVSGIS